MGFTNPRQPAVVPPNQSVLFPDGTQIDAAAILVVQILAGAPLDVVVGLSGTLGTFTYTAASAAAAIDIRNQINIVRAGGSTDPVVTLTDSTTASTWASITPNNFAAGLNTPVFTIAGTGFTMSGINALKIDAGGGHVITYSAGQFSIDSDIQMTTSAAGANWVDIYTLYYSVDGGANWTSTGLTVTMT